MVLLKSSLKRRMMGLPSSILGSSNIGVQVVPTSTYLPYLNHCIVSSQAFFSNFINRVCLDIVL